MKEVMSHYITRGSNVYCCMVDASKAFDKIHFGKMFRLLVEKQVPPDIIKILIDMYERQKICVSWKNVKSNSFTACNGVRQGGVLSPLLFSLYNYGCTY